MTLRIYTGGYHSSTHSGCYILSVVLTVSVLTAGKYIIAVGLNYLCVALGIIGIILIIWLAPVEDCNKPLDQIEKKVFRKRSMISLVIWFVVMIVLFFTPFQNITFILCVSLFAGFLKTI